MRNMSRSGSRAISIRIRRERLEALERPAKATGRPRSWHIEQALETYLDLQAWQVAEIERSIAEMDAGQGIAHEQIERELRVEGRQVRAKR
jgi:RHH-type rel operon transcriptional repressor/antitoxin RelB